MSQVRALRPRVTLIGACSATRRAALLVLGVAPLGCHVFSPGLSPGDASGYSGPDASVSVPDLPLAEDALTETIGPVHGLPSNVGCSDGTREGFRDLTVWPSIAGCAGGWQKPGLSISGTPSKPCSGIAGNDSPNPDGIGCGVADLCAPLWHPCEAKDFASRSRSGCENILPPGEKGFFVAKAGASAEGACDLEQDNDLHGCGNLGVPESSLCPPFTRRMGFADCESTNGVWNCGDSKQNTHEAKLVTKPSPDLGGVLCCKDD
jgi:hypothetical protein